MRVTRRGAEVCSLSFRRLLTRAINQPQILHARCTAAGNHFMQRQERERVHVEQERQFALYTLSILCPLIGSIPQWEAPSLQLWLTVYIVCAEHFTTVDRVPTNWRMRAVLIMLRWLFEVTRCIGPDAKILQVLIILFQCFHILHDELLTTVALFQNLLNISTCI